MSNDHLGHRARMREKFTENSPALFHTHELLEMLLYSVYSCQDTNPVAHRLLDRFSSLAGIFSASREELLSVEGVGERCADVLLSLGAFSEALTDRSVCERERTFSDFRTVGEYFVSYFEEKKTPACVVLLLDDRMRFLSFEHIRDCDFSSGALTGAPFVRAALSVGASVAILAHNHPHGAPIPSEGDLVGSGIVVEALRMAGVTVAEHYIVCGRRFAGFLSRSPFAVRQAGEISRFASSREEYGGASPAEEVLP